MYTLCNHFVLKRYVWENPIRVMAPQPAAKYPIFKRAIYREQIEEMKIRGPPVENMIHATLRTPIPWK